MSTPTVEKRKSSNRRQLSAQANARLSPQELERLREAADLRGQTVSEFIRELVVRETAATA